MLGKNGIDRKMWNALKSKARHLKFGKSAPCFRHVNQHGDVKLVAELVGVSTITAGHWRKRCDGNDPVSSGFGMAKAIDALSPVSFFNYIEEPAAADKTPAMPVSTNIATPLASNRMSFLLNMKEQVEKSLAEVTTAIEEERQKNAIRQAVNAINSQIAELKARRDALTA